jgi:hypothetical protein
MALTTYIMGIKASLSVPSSVLSGIKSFITIIYIIFCKKSIMVDIIPL